MKNLPEYNHRVLAFLEGSTFHSDVFWQREGYAFLVRHEDSIEKDKWSSKFLQDAREMLDMEHIESIKWVYVSKTKEIMQEIESS